LAAGEGEEGRSQEKGARAHGLVFGGLARELEENRVLSASYVGCTPEAPDARFNPCPAPGSAPSSSSSSSSSPPATASRTSAARGPSPASSAARSRSPSTPRPTSSASPT